MKPMLIAALAALSLLTGCSTTLSVFSPEILDSKTAPRIYGGTRLNLGFLFSKSSHKKSGDYLLIAVDTPLCLVADTVLLPYTVTMTLMD